MKRDLLFEIAGGKVSYEQADQILGAILNSPQASDVEKLLGFQRIEWTAYGHGASLSELASWRKNGWPTQCQVCGNQINVESFGWRIVEVAGNSALKHIRCPAKMQG